jgi:hypothetical protein
MALDIAGWLAGTLGPLRLFLGGILSIPLRTDVNLLGDGVDIALTDDPTNKRTNLTLTATHSAETEALVGSGGIAQVTAPEVRNTSDAHCTIHSYVSSVQTTDDTVTTLEAFTMADLTICAFDVVVTAVTSDGTKGGRWKRSVVYQRAGGAATIVGAIETGTDQETDAGLDVTIDTSTNDVRVRVTGLDATILRWGCELRVQEQAA